MKLVRIMIDASFSGITFLILNFVYLSHMFCYKSFHNAFVYFYCICDLKLRYFLLPMFCFIVNGVFCTLLHSLITANIHNCAHTYIHTVIMLLYHYLN